MKRLRDALIITVLGGIVIWFVAGFVQRVHESSVNMSMTVREAEIACIEEGMICHAGYDSFPSVESAEAYLKSPEHLSAVKRREEQKAEQHKKDELRTRAEEFAKQGVKKVKAACIKDGTINCALIDKETAVSFAETILEHQASKEARKTRTDSTM